MKLHFGSPAELVTFEANLSWKIVPFDSKSREYFYGIAAVISATIGIFLFFYCAMFIFNDVINYDLPLYYFLIYFILIVFFILVHELLHLVCHPKFGLSNLSLFILCIKDGAVFVGYSGPIKVIRNIIVLLTPNIFLTFIPLVYVHLVDTPDICLMFPIVMNGFAMGVDLTLAYYLIKEVPFSATLQTCKDGLYWYEQKIK